MSSALGFHPRHGFTAVEMVIVIGIMLLLMSMAVPTVLPALRKGSIHTATADIESAWQQARVLAMETSIPSGSVPPHFGITISQTPGQQAYVAIVYDCVGLNGTPAMLLQGQIPGNPATITPGNPPLVQYKFNRNVILQVESSTGSLETGTVSLTVYAQYCTGFPISPSEVALGNGMGATPVSFGVNVPQLASSSLSPLVYLQSPDYVLGSRGYADSIALFHTGVVATNAIQE